MNAEEFGQNHIADGNAGETQGEVAGEKSDEEKME